MSLYSDFCAYIETKTAITDLIGTRIFPQIAKGGQVLPYAIYSRTDVRRYPASSGSTGLVTTIIRVTSFATTYDGALSLANEFRIALDGKSGTVGSSYFDKCRLIAESDNIDPVEFAQNDAPHFVSQDYQITHTESIPTL